MEQEKDNIEWSWKERYDRHQLATLHIKKKKKNPENVLG